MEDTVSTRLKVGLVALAAFGVTALLALALLLGGGADIFKNALDTEEGKLDEFIGTINDDVKGPVNLAMATIVPIGLAVGGGLLAIGQSRGMVIIGSSCGAGALVLLGNGFIA